MKSKISLLVFFCLCFTTIYGQTTRPDALLEFRQGNYQRAIEICLEELVETPRNMNSYSVLGWSLIANGEYQRALEYGQQALQISRYDPRIIEIIGEAHYFLGNNQEAIRWFEEYAVIAPSGDRIQLVYYFLGEIFIRIGEFNNADIALTKAVYLDSGNHRWWTRLAFAREQASDFVHSLAAYDQALVLSPSFADALRGRERVQSAIESL